MQTLQSEPFGLLSVMSFNSGVKQCAAECAHLSHSLLQAFD